MILGRSLLLDFDGVPNKKLHYEEEMNKIILNAIKISELTLIEYSSHQFLHTTDNSNETGGMTGFALLKESHDTYKNRIKRIFNSRAN
ncbi:MAG: S-adenosylmethionine decarboxylase [Candidatus Heimdallarchaeota archaeon]|nr:S-adenosylmethionine decarboxylase [Candidatus Heimdallarchaeota archaeon]MDH5645608.1 S-adenosylmethionine decarboxylase [Candidatus Heimdallarchaeota archaeon]